ncbi:MAG: hypothetical protein ABSH20_26165 [Tepidisphaeraceae bacterium]|jgi:hypothetical protein
MAKRTRNKALIDRLIVYHSAEDDCWIAHSLRTDQLGTGDCIVDAMADALKAIRQVAALAARDKTVALFREAPRDIQQLAAHARSLPAELFEIAHKMVTGAWPDDMPVDIAPRHHRGGTFAVEIPETELLEMAS